MQCLLVKCVGMATRLGSPLRYTLDTQPCAQTYAHMHKSARTNVHSSLNQIPFSREWLSCNGIERSCRQKATREDDLHQQLPTCRRRQFMRKHSRHSLSVLLNIIMPTSRINYFRKTSFFSAYSPMTRESRADNSVARPP